MDLPASRALVPELTALESSPSTNVELVERARASELAPFSTVVTLDQTAGRGRLGRTWTAPAGTSLAISVLIVARDSSGTPLPLDRFGWFGIAAGVAMSEAVAGALPAASVGFKWPNDVLITGADGVDRKVCGVLAELVTEAHAVVVGAGVNLSMTTDELPVPTATSLAIEGAAPETRAPDAVLAAYLAGLRRHAEAFIAAGGDADASGLRRRARELCMTLGRRVTVELPDGTTLTGTGHDLAADGRLIVRTEAGEVTIAAGDVTHLRHA